MSTTTKTKLGLGVKFAEQILEEGKRPMSPDQIKAKYKLGFPFTIRRVVASQLPKKCDCEKAIKLRGVGTTVTLTEITRQGNYLAPEFTCTYHRHVLDPHQECFVYVDGGVG